MFLKILKFLLKNISFKYSKVKHVIKIIKYYFQTIIILIQDLLSMIKYFIMININIK